MRVILLPLALIAATPAIAQDRPADQAAEVGEILSNPMVQSGIAGLATAFADALLETKVGPLARYADPSSKLSENDTLGDVVRHSNPNYRSDLQNGTRRGVAALGQAAKDSAVMTNELEKTVKRLQNLLDAATEAANAYRQGRP